MTDISSDLNSVIISAVNARVEASVVEALSGDQLMGRYVAGALNREITVRDNYRERKSTFLAEAISEAIKGATTEAVRRVVAEETVAIEEEVRRVLKQRSRAIAHQLVESLTDAAQKAYGIDVTLRMPGSI